MTRNAQQRDKFTSSDFKEVLIDPFLLRLETPSLQPGFADPRHCLVLWARPPDHVIKLASHLQALLKKAAPSMSSRSFAFSLYMQKPFIHGLVTLSTYPVYLTH